MHAAHEVWGVKTKPSLTQSWEHLTGQIHPKIWEHESIYDLNSHATNLQRSGVMCHTPVAAISALECGSWQTCKKKNTSCCRTQHSPRGHDQIKLLIIQHPFQSNCDRLLYFFCVFLLPEEGQRWCFSPQTGQGHRDAAKLAQSFTKPRVAILPLPVPHTRPPLNSLPTHSFPLPLFVSWEDTSLEKPLRRLFKSLCGRVTEDTTLLFLSFGKPERDWKEGPQLPPWRPSSLPSSITPPSPASAWVDSLHRFSDLPSLCDTSVIVRGWQRTGSPGVDGASLKVSSIRLCVMDVAQGPGHLKCTKREAAKHALRASFSPSLTRLQTAINGTLAGDFSVSVWRHKQERRRCYFIDLLQIFST